MKKYEKLTCVHCGKKFISGIPITNSKGFSYCSIDCYYHAAGCTIPKEEKK